MIKGLNMSIDKTFINLDSLIDSAALEKVIKDIENNIKHLETTAEKLLEILKNPKKSVYKILNKSEKNFQTEWEEYVKRVYYKKVKKYFHLV